MVPLFCGSCGAHWTRGRFCGQCGAPQPLLPPAGSPVAGPTDEQAKAPCIPILKACNPILEAGNEHGFSEMRLDQPEFLLCALPEVKASYRLGLEKKRLFFVSSLGRLGFFNGPVTRCIAVLQEPGSNQNNELSASDHVASLREFKVQGTTITMGLRGREFLLECASTSEVHHVVSAVNTVALMLFCGPPPWKKVNIDFSTNQIVMPGASFVIGNNLPPGWELGFTAVNGLRQPYYINVVEGNTSWQLPPDVQGQCPVEQASKYPRCLPDHGLWAAMRLWTFFYHYHSRKFNTAMNSNFTLSAPRDAQPYWCVPGATNVQNGRVSTVIDVPVLISNIVPLLLSSDRAATFQDHFHWYDRIFFPALRMALARNKFFTGLTFSTLPGRAAPAGFTTFPGALSHSGLVNLVQAAAPTLVELSIPAISPMLAQMSREEMRRMGHVLGVQVWSGQHMPKMDLLGRVDTYVMVHLVKETATMKDVKRTDLQFQTEVIKSNYHPDWHHASDLGSVPWYEIHNVPTGSKLMGVVKDKDTIKSDDTIGHFEVPVPSLGGSTEAWYRVSDEKGQAVVGMASSVAATGSCFASLCPFLFASTPKINRVQDQACTEVDNLAQMYVRQRWFDLNSVTQSIKVPEHPSGRLTAIDLSWRDDIGPNVLRYVLHHAGALKTLKLAAITNSVSQDMMPVVARVIADSLQTPGAPLPAGWHKGVHYVENPKAVFRPMQIVVAPGDVFGKVTARVEGSSDWKVDCGTGRAAEVVPAGSLGLIDPTCKGWSQSLRVLDLSCNVRDVNQPWIDSALEGQMASAIARMPMLEELYMASVPIGAVLSQLIDVSTSGGVLPRIKKLDVAAWRGLRTGEESKLLPAVLEALKGGLAQPEAWLRTDNSFLNVKDFGAALNALAGIGMARGADLEVCVPEVCDPAELESVVAGTSFCGAINSSRVGRGLAAAVLRGLTTNTSVSRVNCSRLAGSDLQHNFMIGGGLGLAVQEVRDALHGFLLGNSAVKKLDLSENPMQQCRLSFVPYWQDSKTLMDAFDSFGGAGNLFQYTIGPQGKGWYLSAAGEAIRKASVDWKMIADLSPHSAWALGALSVNKGLTELNVRGCDLGDQGLIALGQALRSNRTLTALNLDCNRFSLDGLKGFKGCLYGNKKIVVPYPEAEESMLVGGLQNVIMQQQRIVMDMKVQIKIACRGGDVKPWLGNPALKQRSLETLRQAKREEGRCRRLIAKIQAEMKWIWGKMSENERIALEKRLAKEQAVEETAYQKELGRQAKMCAKVQIKHNQIAKVQARQAQMRSRPGYKQRPRRYHHRRSRHHEDHDDRRYDSDGWSDDDHDDYMEAEALMAADMDAQDLAGMEAVAAAQEDSAQEVEAAAQVEEAAADAGDLEADLASVEAYGGAGPQDLWGGGGGAGEGWKVAAGARAARHAGGGGGGGYEIEMRHEMTVRMRSHKMLEEEDVVRGTVALEYRKLTRFLVPVEETAEQQVTLVTQCSLDRLPRLAEQAEAYGNAPVSVAIYIPFVAAGEDCVGEQGARHDEEAEAEMLASIRRLHAELESKGVGRLTISLLFGNAPSEHEYDNLYPINALRNLALHVVATELVLLVDVDFVPSPQLALLCGATPAPCAQAHACPQHHTAGTGSNSAQEPVSYAEARSLCGSGAVLVVPAFEVGMESELDELPSTQKDLASLWREGRAEGFHVSKFPKGHSPTDFERWFESSVPYGVGYQEHFEPYVIAWRGSVPRYDERFRGYGMNKISHLHEIAASGKTFVVLPGVFLTAREHARSASYQRVFGDARDPAHAVRIALLWGSFKRSVHDKYSKPQAPVTVTAATHSTTHSTARNGSDWAPLQPDLIRMNLDLNLDLKENLNLSLNQMRWPLPGHVAGQNEEEEKSEEKSGMRSEAGSRAHELQYGLQRELQHELQHGGTCRRMFSPGRGRRVRIAGFKTRRGKRGEGGTEGEMRGWGREGQRERCVGGGERERNCLFRGLRLRKGIGHKIALGVDTVSGETGKEIWERKSKEDRKSSALRRVLSAHGDGL